MEGVRRDTLGATTAAVGPTGPWIERRPEPSFGVACPRPWRTGGGRRFSLLPEMRPKFFARRIPFGRSRIRL